MEYREANRFIPSTALAKLDQPWLPLVFPRGRLFERLDAFADRPCAWIGAPGGYGKTTLAASYVEARGIPCLWYQFDEDDADPATFFYYLGIAVTAQVANAALPLLTPEYQDNLPTFTRRYVQALGQSLRAPFVLLFDNYHRLPAASPLHAVWAEVLDHLPAGVRCLITSRGEPPPALTRARLHGQLTIIAAEELRLTQAEAEGIAGLQTEHRLTAAEVQSLNERAQGWAAGLNLLLRRSHPTRTPPPLATTELLFDYFAVEVWNQLDPALQSFLLKTALLPKMTAAMAEQLTGDEGAETLLEALVRCHSFTFRGEIAGSDAATRITTYQYHDLFRDFLLNRGREAFSAMEREQDQRQAAVLLETAGEISAAVELWQALGDWERLSRLVIQQAEPLLRQGRGQLLEVWLNRFPPAIRDRSPWLLFWLGQCQLHRDAVAARTTLVRAYRRFKHAGDVAGLWLAWSAITDTYGLAWDNFQAAGGWMVEFERLRTRYPSFPSTALEARVTCGVFNLLVHARPEHPEFADWERRITRLLQTDCPPDLYLVSLNTLLLHYIWNVGQHGKAAWALSILRAANTDATHVEPVLRCAWYWGEFCYQYWYEGDLTQCLAIAEVGWSTAVEHGANLFKGILLSAFVHANLSAGRLEASRAALERYTRLQKSFRPLERVLYDTLTAWEAWQSGRLPEALELLEQTLRVARRIFYHTTAIIHLGLAQVQASLGHRSDALRHLAGMRPWIRATHSQVATFLRALAAAQFALAWGQKARSLRLLRLALALARVQGYIFFSFFKPDDVARLCAVALDADIEVEYVQTLIRKRGLLPDLTAAMSERWPWSVKIYTLGRFALLVDDQPVTFGRKVQHKPLELLKILIAWGGRDVSQARIADVLWPDAEGDAAQQTLATTLHRLRRLLSHEHALSVRDGRLSLDSRYCWVDVWCLERHINQTLARACETNGGIAPADLATATDVLLRAYHGPFLGQDPEPWAMQTRDHLRNRYLKCLDEIGDYWEKMEDWSIARACYERGLEVDATVERRARNLRRCHERLGQPAEAVRLITGSQ
ncbi:MAG: hypothetical protein IPM89_15265 [Candidatus Competibacteraceae bacterium]|nr:MAG: hypothetical protein IPM89_15265 [Candidatus Competibacteraceae bacterium]